MKKLVIFDHERLRYSSSDPVVMKPPRKKDSTLQAFGHFVCVLLTTLNLQLTTCAVLAGRCVESVYLWGFIGRDASDANAADAGPQTPDWPPREDAHHVRDDLFGMVRGKIPFCFSVLFRLWI